MPSGLPRAFLSGKSPALCRWAWAGFCMALSLAGLSCAPADSLQAYLTYSIQRSTFTVTVDARGTLEAKKAHTLITPRMRWQPEIYYLTPEGTAVAKGDTVVVLDSEDLVRDYVKTQDALALARAEARRKEAELTLERLKLEADQKNAEASAEIAELQMAKLAFTAPRLREIKRLEALKSELRAQKSRKQLASLEIIQKEDRARYQLEIEQAERKLKQAQEALDKLILTAPVDGFVIYERSWRSGEKIQEGDGLWSGNPLVKIPDLSTMQVRLQVGEIEAQKLQKGQPATVSISSAGRMTLSGRVASVARRATPVKRGSKVKQVEVIVELDSTRADLTPGLTADARITVEERPGAFVVPLECVFRQDSLNVVYVRGTDVFAPREITVAVEGADFAVIEGPLEDGAALALRRPSTSLIR